MTNVVKLKEHTDTEGVLDGEIGPLIPDGSYEAVYTHHDTKIVYNTPKVFVHFKIVQPGPYYGTKLYRAYRAASISGKGGKNGRFKLKQRSELFLTLCNLNNRKLRPDQISTRCLCNAVLKITVRTVTKDYKQRPLAEVLRYSVVGSIDAMETGCSD